MDEIRLIGFYNSKGVWGHSEFGVTVGWAPRVRRGSLNVFLWNWCLIVGPHFAPRRVGESRNNNAVVEESFDADPDEKGQ